MNRKVSIAAAVVLWVAGSAQAQTSDWRFIASAGFGGGGEAITSGTIVNVSNNAVTPFTIRAGDGLQVRVGAEYALSNAFAVQMSIGHSAVAPMGMNGSLTFTTIPVEVMALARISEGWRLGLGVRKAHAEMAGSGVASNAPVLGTYETSVGTVAEVQYLFAQSDRKQSDRRPEFGISARYVTEDYRLNGYSFNGNHYELGVVLYY